MSPRLGMDAFRGMLEQPATCVLAGLQPESMRREEAHGVMPGAEGIDGEPAGG